MNLQSAQIKLLNTFADSFHQGMIYVKEDGTIGAYSTLAKKIVGMILPEGKSHPAGKVNSGDIVILADNKLGNDDMMSPDDLRVLNIKDKDIEPGDSILAIGVYDNNKIKPEYKVFRNELPGMIAELRLQYLGFNISTSIDYGKGRMSVTVNDEEYGMNFIENIGYAVILDGSTGQVKFFQEKGYSYRNEEIGNLLRGQEFMGKNLPGQPKDLHPTVGLPAHEVLEGKKIIEDYSRLMASEDGECLEGVYEVFRRMLYCTLIRVKSGSENDGVYILVQDKELAEKTKTADVTFNAAIEEKEKLSIMKYDESTYDSFMGFIGNSTAMRNVKSLAAKAARTRFNVIITGESGTGKSRLAREIHNAGNPDAPFVEVSCNAIAPSLFESELFGYTAGSFTGADTKGRAGYFEEANGGTIFLDEISEIPPEIQVKLLNVLQNKRIYRVGSAKPIDIDVRIITASNRDLEKEVLNGNFRQDLYYRVNVFPINIPPLRERRRDLYILANSILSEMCKEYGIEEKQFSEEALTAIRNYNWPGNVRELENIIERAIVLCNGRLIYSEHLMIPDSELTARSSSLKDRLELEEKRIVLEAMSSNMGDKKAVMEELGMSKTALYDKLKKYGME